MDLGSLGRICACREHISSFPCLGISVNGADLNNFPCSGIDVSEANLGSLPGSRISMLNNKRNTNISTYVFVN